MDERREAIIDIVNELGPATVRQAYYQAEVRGVLPKEEKSYNKVQYLLVKLRRSGEIDYDSIKEIRGLDVAITTTAETDEQAEALLRGLGLPIATEEQRS